MNIWITQVPLSDPNPGVPIAAGGRDASGVRVQGTKEDRTEVGVQSTGKDHTGAEAGARNGTIDLQIGGETVTHPSFPPEGAGTMKSEKKILSFSLPRSS